MEMSVFAPAKVNLHLAVKDKRNDGFHNLESLFLALDFGDDIFFSPAFEEDTLSMEPTITVNSNIILRALSLFREKTEYNQRFSIKVIKRIPIGGGLGGGSSDAASTLLALNKMAGSPLEIEQLLEMGAALGSDVPFFLRQTQAAWVTGRGEIIEPVEVPKMYLVLVNPGFPSDTGTAFRKFDEFQSSQESHAEAPRHGAFAREPILNNVPPLNPRNLNFKISTLDNHEGKIKISNDNSVPPCLRENSFLNSFLPVFDDDVKTIYTKIISQLLEAGAQYANLSGAGSTCFGVFENNAQAQKAAEALQHDWSFVKWCQSP